MNILIIYGEDGQGHKERCQILYNYLIRTCSDCSVSFMSEDYYSSLLYQSSWDIIIVDSYNLTTNEALSGAGVGIYHIDDGFNKNYNKLSSIINPNPYSEELDGDHIYYPLKNPILNENIVKIKNKIKIKRKVKNILIRTGIPKVDRKIWNKIFAQGYSVISCGTTSKKEFYKNLINCDIFISGCGQTLHEIAYLGIPTVGVCVADNQKFNGRYYNQKEIISYIPDEKMIDTCFDSAFDSLLDYKKRKNIYKKRKEFRNYINGTKEFWETIIAI